MGRFDTARGAQHSTGQSSDAVQTGPDSFLMFRTIGMAMRTSQRI